MTCAVIPGADLDGEGLGRQAVGVEDDGQARERVARRLLLGGQVGQRQRLEVAVDLGRGRRRVQRRDVDAEPSKRNPGADRSARWAAARVEPIHGAAVGQDKALLLDQTKIRHAVGRCGAVTKILALTTSGRSVVDDTGVYQSISVRVGDWCGVRRNP